MTDYRFDSLDYFWIWPNLMLNVYPDNFSIVFVLGIKLGPWQK